VSLPVVVTPEAKGDIRAAVREFNELRTGFGLRFSLQIQEILDRLETYPRLYPAVWQDVRAVRLKGFRHVLYHVVMADRVEVIGVIHGARDSSIWRSRR
jgi:toxin ParE1/3/4